MNIACFDLSAVHFLFFCQCCPAWYPGQSLIPDEELDTDVGMQQPALHNTTYPKCRVNAEPTVQEMIYWWGFKENHINLDVCYLEVIILRVVASYLGKKRLFSSFGVFQSVLSNHLWNGKAKMPPPYHPTPTCTPCRFRLLSGKMEGKTGLTRNPVCIISCIVLTLLKISFKYLHSTCRAQVFKTRNTNACFVHLVCLCSKSRTQDPYNCCLT